MKRSDILHEEPRDGEKCGCGEQAELVCYTPVHNGVHSQAIRNPLCETCAYLIAEEIQTFYDELAATREPPAS